MSKKDLQKLKVQEEVEKTLHDYCVEGGHTFPRSRREFLSSGLISLSATVMAPTLFSLINNRAQAAEGCPVGDPSLSPFIQINLAGGAALCANFVAGDEQGNLLSSYQRMGLGTTPSLTRVCSNQAPFATGSGFLSGLQAGANAEHRQQTVFAGGVPEPGEQRCRKQAGRLCQRGGKWCRTGTRRFRDPARAACRGQHPEAGQQAGCAGDAVELASVQAGQPLAERGIQPEYKRLSGSLPEQLKKFAIKAIDLGTEARFRPLSGHLTHSNMG